MRTSDSWQIPSVTILSPSSDLEVRATTPTGSCRTRSVALGVSADTSESNDPLHCKAVSTISGSRKM